MPKCFVFFFPIFPFAFCPSGCSAAQDCSKSLLLERNVRKAGPRGYLSAFLVGVGVCVCVDASVCAHSSGVTAGFPGRRGDKAGG